MSKNVELFTAQNPIVLEDLKQKGQYVVRKAYIQEKHGFLAPVMLNAYDWFVSKLKETVELPSNAEYPVWFFKDLNHAVVKPGYKVLKLKIPEKEIVYFDHKGWEQVLSLSYLGENIEDQKNFEGKLNDSGVATGMAVFQRPKYSQMKSEIMTSWERIFDLKEDTILRAATWQIKKDWVVEEL